ncbi:MAG: hypothetical protein J5895_01850 [Alphaproteobacteria bacterium]|nr:hypothetical protein [Alphaproteobacteria bacterium]
MTRIILVSRIGQKKGQTLFAAHLATILAETKKTALIDFEQQDKVLQNFMERRKQISADKKLQLPVAQLQKNFSKETAQTFDFVVLDAKDASLFEHADILVVLVSDDGVGALLKKDSTFLSTVWEAKKKRAARGLNAFHFFVLPNGDFSVQNQAQIKKDAQIIGCQITPALKDNAAYAQGLNDGVTVLDKNLPFFEKTFNQDDFFARRNLKQIVQFILPNK